MVPISLAGVLVPAENDQWSKTGAFKAMPRGKQVFGGVEFWLEGVIELTEEGEAPRIFRKGDSFLMKPGYVGRWKTLETVRKIYVIVG